jgi:hypothetical protein
MAIVRAYSKIKELKDIETIITVTDSSNIPEPFNYVSARNIFINPCDTVDAVEKCRTLLSNTLQFNETAYTEFMNNNIITKQSTESNITKLSNMRKKVTEV